MSDRDYAMTIKGATQDGHLQRPPLTVTLTHKPSGTTVTGTLDCICELDGLRDKLNAAVSAKRGES